MRISSGNVNLFAQTTYQQNKKTTINHLDSSGNVTVKNFKESNSTQVLTSSAQSTTYENIQKSANKSNNDTVTISETGFEEFSKLDNTQIDIVKMEKSGIDAWLNQIFSKLDDILNKMGEYIKDSDQNRLSMLKFNETGTGRVESTQNKLSSIRKNLSEAVQAHLDFMNGVSSQYNREKIENLKYEQNMIVESVGKVHTEDGREIEFKLDIGSVQKGEINSVQRYKVIDPLVINFNGDSTKLQDMRFQFDLDSDGEDDSIPYLNSGNGFLALDINGDGKVNDGSELFGTRSGNGFIDLAEYDEDGNMWIDENDSIFEKLSVWMQNSDQDEGELVSLYQTGIGAIHLGHVQTDAKLFDSNGNVLGVIGQSGVALSEEGRALNVQSLDIAL